MLLKISGKNIGQNSKIKPLKTKKPVNTPLNHEKSVLHSSNVCVHSSNVCVHSSSARVLSSSARVLSSSALVLSSSARIQSSNVMQQLTIATRINCRFTGFLSDFYQNGFIGQIVEPLIDLFAQLFAALEIRRNRHLQIQHRRDRKNRENSL